MTSFLGISPLINYKQNANGANQHTEQTASTSEIVHNLLADDIPTDKVGTTSTKVARKGVKYVWNKFINYFSKHFSDKAIDETNTPKYNYEA